MKPHFIFFNYTYSSTLCSVLKFSTTMFKGPFCALATSEKLQEDLRKLIQAQEGTYEVSKESHILGVRR